MKFPNAGDIASTNVFPIDIHKSINDAITQMIQDTHRDIIVVDDDKFFILTSIDIIEINRKNINLETSLSEIALTKIPSIYKNVNVLNILKYLDEKTEYICVKNPDETLYGIITHTDITSNIDPQILMDNYRLDDFLKLTRRVKWIDKEKKTKDVLSDMARSLFDSVVIVEDSKPIGILTTKDVVELIKKSSDLNVPIKKYMTSPVNSVSDNLTINEALSFVKRHHYKRLVVVNSSGVLVGIVTQKELISLTYSKWALMMREHQEELKEINSILKAQNKEYELMASTDSLTKLYNRYKFTQLYDSSHTTMSQREGKMSLILLDIDFFKEINDLYGHNEGDKVLVNIAQLLQSVTRKIDIVCRWGGEEFVILLPAVDIKDALLIAQKIRKKIEKTKINEVKKITASFGVAEVYAHSDLEEVIGRADKALYLAKKSGRNCVKNQNDI